MDDAATLHLPRILCLHGGGVNALVFRLQCRVIILRLQHRFRLVFADAPFPSLPHAKIVAVYGEHAPFFRWLPWLPSHPELDDDVAAGRIVDACRAAMDADEEGTGPWVGVLGFSQGARVAASLLWAQERLRAMGEEPLTDFRFGVFMAGSPPPVRLDGRVPETRYVAGPGRSSLGYDDWPADADADQPGDHVLSTPTLHVHGLQDPDVARHRLLLTKYCRPGTTRVVEWDGDHRLPIKTPDVAAVVEQLLAVAKNVGVV